MAMIVRTSALSLLSMLLSALAVAQTPSWPIVNGRHLQPTQQQIDSKTIDKARQRDRDVQPEIDRIYEELTPDAPRSKR